MVNDQPLVGVDDQSAARSARESSLAACRADRLLHSRGKGLRARQPGGEFRAHPEKPARRNKRVRRVDKGCVYQWVPPRCRARTGMAYWLLQWRYRARVRRDIRHRRARHARATPRRGAHQAAPNGRAAASPTSRTHRRTSAAFEAQSSLQDIPSAGAAPTQTPRACGPLPSA